MTKRNLYLLSFGVALMMIGATQTRANPVSCANHSAVVERLSDVYGERRQAMGLGRNNAVIEVYASDDSGSWSITVTKPGGQTCLVAAGEGFTLIDEPLDEDADT